MSARELQRKCVCGGTPGPSGECEACRRKRLQRRAASAGPALAPPIVHDVLRAPGQPLDAGTRAYMEPRFGHSFADVRVHTDARAAESARAVDAAAYTVGSDVVFAGGRYEPRGGDGRRLLAHELAHVVQQRGTIGSLPLEIAPADGPGEREAAAAAAAVERGGGPGALPASPSVLARQAVEPEGGNDAGTCNPALPGLAPTGPNCSAYMANASWLPLAYVNNATCACLNTPDSRTANCVRAVLQARLAATPAWLKAMAVAQKAFESGPLSTIYHEWVQLFLTPRIYLDHLVAYRSCCCSSGPAPYPAWIGVTTVPLPCDAVGWSIRTFGSCHGTPGTW